MKAIYLFGQSLTNTGDDDWYIYHINGELIQVIDRNTLIRVSNLMSKVTANGKSGTTQNIEYFYYPNHKHTIDVVLIINNNQKDILGRTTSTAMIIPNCHNLVFNIHDALETFWDKTNRNATKTRELAHESSTVLENIQKKSQQPKLLTRTVVFILMSLIALSLFLWSKS